MIPIALSVFLWDRVFKRKKIAFHVVNLAVVSVELEVIEICKSNEFVEVYRSMMGHFHMKAFHISSANKRVADAFSRGQFQNFKELAPEADTFPTAVPMELWSLLNSTLSIYLKIIYLKTHGMYMLMLKNHLKKFKKIMISKRFGQFPFHI